MYTKRGLPVRFKELGCGRGGRFDFVFQWLEGRQSISQIKSRWLYIKQFNARVIPFKGKNISRDGLEII